VTDRWRIVFDTNIYLLVFLQRLRESLAQGETS